MDVSGQLYAPALLPPGKNPGTHWIEGWVDPSASLYFWRREKHFACNGISTPALYDYMGRSFVYSRIAVSASESVYQCQ
jgi:hypothetical protein